MIERIQHPSDIKRASKNKTKCGIKALITCGDLGSLLAAAKQWYKVRTERGEDATKLLHHIANAEAVYHKYNKRNANAFEMREERRRAEVAETEVAPTVTAAQTLCQSQTQDEFEIDTRKGVWEKLTDAFKRPTRW